AAKPLQITKTPQPCPPVCCAGEIAGRASADEANGPGCWLERGDRRSWNAFAGILPPRIRYASDVPRYGNECSQAGEILGVVLHVHGERPAVDGCDLRRRGQERQVDLRSA